MLSVIVLGCWERDIFCACINKWHVETVACLDPWHIWKSFSWKIGWAADGNVLVQHSSRLPLFGKWESCSPQLPRHLQNNHSHLYKLSFEVFLAWIWISCMGSECQWRRWSLNFQEGDSGNWLTGPKNNIKYFVNCTCYLRHRSSVVSEQPLLLVVRGPAVSGNFFFLLG